MGTSGPTPIEFKVVVAGPFHVGKTTFISNISAVPIVGTEVPTTGDEALEKETTTVGLEYGRYAVATPSFDISLLLYGTPGQKRFRFMWETVAVGADGCIVLVDASRPETWDDAADAVDFFGVEHEHMSIVGANRSELGSPEHLDLVEWLAHRSSMPVIPCNVTDVDSSKYLLSSLFDLLIGEDAPATSAVTDVHETNSAMSPTPR